MLTPVGVAVYGNYVYWIDRESRNVERIKKKDEIGGVIVQAKIDDLSDMIVVDTMKTRGRKGSLAFLDWWGDSAHGSFNLSNFLIFAQTP